MPLNTRQRVLLRLLANQGGSVDLLALMKWLFLYSQETANNVSRYDFVPYHYGPYSFEASKDLHYSLARFVEKSKHTICLRQGVEEEIQADIARIPNKEQKIADEIWACYRQMSTEKLLRLVYERYPWYASLSKRVENPPRQVADVAVYTIGYEGRSIDAFFNYVLNQGIVGILDVRRNAFSQKYGFMGNTLRDLCVKLNLIYSHIPELGIDSEFRKDLNSYEAYEQLFAKYENTLSHQSDTLAKACEIMKSCPTTLLCFEAEANSCHRSRLAPKIASLTGYSVKHL